MQRYSGCCIFNSGMDGFGGVCLSIVVSSSGMDYPKAKPLQLRDGNWNGSGPYMAVQPNYSSITCTVMGKRLLCEGVAFSSGTGFNQRAWRVLGVDWFDISLQYIGSNNYARLLVTRYRVVDHPVLNGDHYMALLSHGTYSTTVPIDYVITGQELYHGPDYAGSLTSFNDFEELSVSDFSYPAAPHAYDYWYGVQSFGYPLSSRVLVHAQEAASKAVETFPEAQCNTLANILELASALSSLITGDFARGGVKIGSLSEAWLGYRYSYGTTAMDIREYVDITERLISLAGSSKFKLNGYASDGDYRYHCVLVLDTATVFPQDTVSVLRTYGLKLSAYNAWDMIPYSFIIDWFTHIGDLISVFETRNKLIDLPVSESWTTMTSTDGSTYLRFPGHYWGYPPMFNFGKVGGRTLAYRVADAISLLFG